MSEPLNEERGVTFDSMITNIVVWKHLVLTKMEGQQGKKERERENFIFSYDSK